MLNDPLANALSKILNYERAAKPLVQVHPASIIIKHVLTILNQSGYIGQAEPITENKGGVLNVHLLGKINKCCAIKPRFSVKLDEYEKFEKRYLPAQGVGILVVSTPKGIMTHEEAKKQGMGARLLAYCY